MYYPLQFPQQPEKPHFPITLCISCTAAAATLCLIIARSLSQSDQFTGNQPSESDQHPTQLFLMAAANIKRKGASAAAADALTLPPHLHVVPTYVEYTHVPEYDQLPVAERPEEHSNEEERSF